MGGLPGLWKMERSPRLQSLTFKDLSLGMDGDTNLDFTGPVVAGSRWVRSISFKRYINFDGILLFALIIFY